MSDERAIIGQVGLAALVASAFSEVRRATAPIPDAYRPPAGNQAAHIAKAEAKRERRGIKRLRDRKACEAGYYWHKAAP